jgi:hypothetical protein
MKHGEQQHDRGTPEPEKPMGRWAQRKRGGGGGGQNLVIVMTEALRLNPFDLQVTYSQTVNSGDFAGADFETQPSIFNPVLIAQTTPATLTLTFGNNIAAETDLTSTAAVTNLENPQTITIT